MRPNQKDLGKVVRKSRWCWQFSSIIVVLCITNSFQLPKLSTRNIIEALCVSCEKLFAKRDRNYGPITIGFFTTIFHSTHVAPQPPYSPDLAPCDFWLFTNLKRRLRRIRFESIEEIERETVRALKSIPTDDFSACFKTGGNVGTFDVDFEEFFIL